MTTISRTEAHEAMLRHHAVLGEQVAQRVKAVREAIDDADAGGPRGTGYEPAVAELVAFLGDEVLPHAAAEENSIYPVAAARAELARVVAQMLDEHQRLVALTEELASAKAAAVVAVLSQEIAELFGFHVVKENDLLLPPLFADYDVDVVDLLARMHQLSEEAQQGSRSSALVSADALDEALLSLLLDAANELARAGRAERACQLTAAAWARLHDPRPDLAVRVTATLHQLARLATDVPVTFDTGPTVGNERTEPAIGPGAERRCPMAQVDARPIIAAGGEPFETIMETVTSLGVEEELVVLAPFEPVTLEGVLSSQGFIYEASEIGDGDWRVTFRRPA